MAYLRIVNLKKSYRVSRTQTQDVLCGLNVEFKRGELCAVLGESGCGKSTFMNILAGLDNDYTGSIVLDGAFLKDYTEKQLDDYRKNKVGLVFQSYNLISHMTVAENIEVAMTMSNISKDQRKARTREVLEVVKLLDCENKLPSQLSGGQRQRVAIARALVNDPEILLADEPTGALDKDSSEMVANILKSVAESGKLVIVVTHSQKVAQNCSRIVTIDNGVICSDETLIPANPKLPRPKQIKPQNIKFKNLFKLAWDNIKQSKKRSLLVSIGMSIGIAAVIIVFCLSSGITTYVNDNLTNSMETLQIEVQSSSSITKTQIKMLESIEGVDYTVKGNFMRLNSSYSFSGDEGTIMMLNQTYDKLEKTYVSGGICSDDEIIINEAFANNIYNNTYSTADRLLNQTVDITFSGFTKTFTIVGVYEDSTDYGEYACAYITDDSMEDLYTGGNKKYYTNVLYVYVEDTSYISAVMESIEAFGFTPYRSDSTIETILTYVDLGTKVLTGFSLITIAVSAIMIFIVTYISVIERTREIGVLRAVGGRKKDITVLFVSESFIIGLMAGIIAIIVALFISIVANIAIKSAISVSIIDINVWVYLLGLAISLIASVGSGLMPSMQAANLDPIEALRSE